MDQLQRHFEKLFYKQNLKRQDLVELKHEAQAYNPEISNALAHILEDTSSTVSPAKLQKIKKLYNEYF